MSDKATRDDTVRTRRISTLPQTPGFQELLEDLTAAEQRSWNRITAEMRAGTLVDQRAVDEMRGVSRALALLRKGPERAAKRLDKAEAEAEEAEHE